MAHIFSALDIQLFEQYAELQVDLRLRDNATHRWPDRFVNKGHSLPLLCWELIQKVSQD
ncbi:hypothetical protein IQ264_31175 [Phormidium sp. LEGE 05292]|uniref:hypothetical protein n=1 Tax=[Phormidium] sp. LEGE 05292 TaxID=767427 RepID=UPI00188235DA|nr:hypothetical protein [Phormidium sp. LEGE 05292]MBE9229867.1 hypothetical protein [Phormidium sp. LEGE 05292]